MSTERRRPPAIELLRKLGMEPDPWQTEVLDGDHPRLLLNCSRQAGKSTVVAMLGLAQALFIPLTKVVLVSRSHRQSRELFGIVREFLHRLGMPMVKRLTHEELLLSNHSRMVCLPCREDTIRGFSRVNLMMIDEAARVPDELFRAVMPMLAVCDGRIVCLSTPYGKRGFFFDAWARGGSDWSRIEVPAGQIGRIRPAFLAEQRRIMGESFYRQEYECSFEAMEGLVYPDFARCVAAGPVPASGRRVGGIDFGFHNPFAAVWGTLDRDGVLWLTGEHYARQKPLGYHAGRLPRDVMWYADPSGANERCELRCAGLTVAPGINALGLGIAAVTARLGTGTLRVLADCCPNLLVEASLYRYGEDCAGGSENPLDESNHALAALRYLVTRIDGRRMARPEKDLAQDSASVRIAADKRTGNAPFAWMSAQRRYLWTNEACWRGLA